MRIRAIYAVVVAAAMATCCLPAESQAAASTKPAAVFVFADRTDRHAKYSSSEVFHSLLDETMAFLRENHVVIAIDEFGGRTYSENATPVETIFTMARDAHASSVLHLNVDRPATKWIKVTARCYDGSGKLLWEEKAESGGGLSGAHGLKVGGERLREVLRKHFGQEGLPVNTSVGAAQTSNPPDQK